MEDQKFPDDHERAVSHDGAKQRREINKKPSELIQEIEEFEDCEQLFKAHDSDLKGSDKPSSRKPLPPPDPMDENRESRMSDPSNDCI